MGVNASFQKPKPPFFLTAVKKNRDLPSRLRVFAGYHLSILTAVKKNQGKEIQGIRARGLSLKKGSPRIESIQGSYPILLPHSGQNLEPA